MGEIIFALLFLISLFFVIFFLLYGLPEEGFTKKSFYEKEIYILNNNHEYSYHQIIESISNEEESITEKTTGSYFIGKEEIILEQEYSYSQKSNQVVEVSVYFE